MLKNFIKIAVRNFWNKRLFSLINLIGLALGMSACLSICYYVGYEFSFNRSIQNHENIYKLAFRAPSEKGPSYKDYFPYGLKPLLENSTGIEESFRLVNIDYQNNALAYKSNDINKEYTQPGVRYADYELVSVLGLHMIEGDPSAMQNPFKILINESVSAKFFGSQSALGKTLTLRNNVGVQEFDVIGVFNDLPTNSTFEFEVLLSMPSLNVSESANLQSDWETDKCPIYFSSQLKEKELNERLASLIETTPLAKEHPGDWESIARPISDLHLASYDTNGNYIETSRNFLIGLMIIGLFILIMAWLNFINLSTARATERAREVGVRKTLGSSTFQLMRQFLTESFLLNFAAAILAVTLVQLLLPFFQNITNAMQLLPEDKPVVYAILGILLIIGSLLSGAYPAFILSGFKPINVLKGNLGVRGTGALLRKFLVVFQFIASAGIITWTFVVYEQLTYMQDKDLGLRIDDVVIIDAPAGDLNQSNNNFFDVVNSFKEEVQNFNGVNHMTATSFVPGNNIGWRTSLWRMGESVEDAKSIELIASDRDFDKTFQLEVIAGRFYEKGDDTFRKGQFVINETAAKLLGFSTPEEAVGAQINEAYMFPQLTIVGVVKDFHQQSLQNKIVPCGFALSIWSKYYALSLNLNKNAGSANQTKALKATMNEIKVIWNKFFPDVAFDYTFLDQSFDKQYKSDRQLRAVMTIFALISVVIASIGLVGLSTYSFYQRSKEIGIRKVLGASTFSVFTLLSKDYLVLIIIADLITLPLAYYIAENWLSNYSYQIDLTIWILAAPLVMIFLIEFAAMSYMVVRASFQNPVNSLKHE